MSNSAAQIVQSATRQAGETLSRAQLTTGVEVRPFVAQRMADATAALSRVGLAAAAAELCNAALQRLAELVYQRDYDGGMPNLAPTTGRIEIAAPMAKKGHEYFGLRRGEQAVLRALLVARMQRADPPALFLYNDDDRRWYVNLRAYPTLTAAMQHLEQWPIGSREYRRQHDRIKAERTAPAA